MYLELIPSDWFSYLNLFLESEKDQKILRVVLQKQDKTLTNTWSSLLKGIHLTIVLYHTVTYQVLIILYSLLNAIFILFGYTMKVRRLLKLFTWFSDRKKLINHRDNICWSTLSNHLERIFHKIHENIVLEFESFSYYFWQLTLRNKIFLNLIHVTLAIWSCSKDYTIWLLISTRPLRWMWFNPCCLVHESNEMKVQ